MVEVAGEVEAVTTRCRGRRRWRGVDVEGGDGAASREAVTTRRRR
jgi:hypothetical protein